MIFFLKEADCGIIASNRCASLLNVLTVDKLSVPAMPAAYQPKIRGFSFFTIKMVSAVYQICFGDEFIND